MPDTKNIVITLKYEGETTSNVEDKAKQDKVDPALKNNQDSSDGGAAKAIAIQAGERVLNEITSLAEYEWNKSLNLSDDYIGQRQKQVAMQCVNTTISTISTVGSFAAIGGPIGAVVGLLVSGVSLGKQIWQNYDQENIRLRQMDAQLSYTRARAGWSTNAASIGEDL